jgi:hypothetical protein
MRRLGPEWIAAIALSIQALIFAVQAGFFYWQARILGRHAATLEEHTKIAGSQVKTAELIGQALDQQGKILAEQTKIMAAQFNFQRKVVEQSERMRILDQLVDLNLKVNSLLALLLSVSNYTDAVDERVKAKWADLTDQLLRCKKELDSSIHITGAEKDYFLSYVLDVNQLEQGGDFREHIVKSKAIQSKHKDVTAKIFAAAKTPAST